MHDQRALWRYGRRWTPGMEPAAVGEHEGNYPRAKSKTGKLKNGQSRWFLPELERSGRQLRSNCWGFSAVTRGPRPTDTELILEKMNERCNLRGLMVVATVGLLAGCATTQQWPTQPFDAAALTQRHLLPNSSGQDLIYASDRETLYILSYPDGKVLFSDFRQARSMCSDTSGNVYVAAQSGAVYVYPHGATTPARSIFLPENSYVFGCGSDPATGNLAVAYDCENDLECNHGFTAIAVYKNAQGTPTVYPDPNIYFQYCGYDNQGNLFAMGLSVGVGHYRFAELAAGHKSFVNYTLNPKIGKKGGQVQWDGQYITVQDRRDAVIYRFRIRDGKVKTAGLVRFYGGIGPQGESWIQGNTVLVPYRNSRRSPNYLAFFDYPQGGEAIKTITSGLGGSTALIGLTVSVAP